MIKKLFLILTFYISLYANPYDNLENIKKINLMVNYFFNEELQTYMPKKPVKDILQDDDVNLDPVKYELYFNYIQRLKAIHDSRVEEQSKIDEKYAGKVAFYNGKLKNLKKFYMKAKNQDTILQHSINRAFKVVYGNPKFHNIQYSDAKDEFYGKLVVDNIYNIAKFDSKKVIINIPKEKIDKFLRDYQSIKPKIQFRYTDHILEYKNILFDFDGKEYKGIFTTTPDDKIKLNLKINDDIFRLIKIEDTK